MIDVAAGDILTTIIEVPSMKVRKKNFLLEGSGYPIKLISFWSESETASLHRAAAQLNYQVELVNTKSWLREKAVIRHEAAMLALPTAGQFDSDIYAGILKNVSMSQRFAVFFQHITDSLLPILKSSPECCWWPCEQHELALRLKRISSPVAERLNERAKSSTAHYEPGKWSCLNLVGSSPAFRRSLVFIEKASCCDAPVLIEGETGTGKEMAARAIHNLGPRRSSPFVPINCGAVPDDLIVNELFGHERGAFTGASRCQSGQIAEANGGTLLLDEIEALSPKGQVALLRFVEEQRIRPLGASAYKKVNVRIISASNSSLSELMNQGLFRQDLWFRLNLLQLRLPPLRERHRDINRLAQHFVDKFRNQYHCHERSLSLDALEWMNRYPWPGNVRELENYIQRVFLLNDETSATTIEHNLPSTDIRNLINRCVQRDAGVSFNEAKHSVVYQFERRYLTDLMARTNGNVSQAAIAVQKERRTLGKLLKKHHIDPAQYRAGYPVATGKSVPTD